MLLVMVPRWWRVEPFHPRAARADAPAGRRSGRGLGEWEALGIEVAVGKGEAGAAVVGIDAQATVGEPDVLGDAARGLVVGSDPRDHRLGRIERCRGGQPGRGELAGVSLALLRAGDAVAEVPRPGTVALRAADPDHRLLVGQAHRPVAQALERPAIVG